MTTLSSTNPAQPLAPSKQTVPETPTQTSMQGKEQKLSSKFEKPSPYLPPLKFEHKTFGGSRRVDPNMLSSMMLSNPLSKMPIRTRNSKKFTQTIAGDAVNGNSVTHQKGVWSASGKNVFVSGDGAHAAAFGQGSVGRKVQADLTKTGHNKQLIASSNAWTGAQGHGSAQVTGGDNSAHGSASASAKGRLGAGVEAKVTAKLGSNGVVQATAGASAMVGMETVNRVSVKVMEKGSSEQNLPHKNSVDASVGGFAGAKAESHARVDIKGNTVGVNATALAGVGAKAELHASVEKTEDGEHYLDLSSSASVAAGVGAGIGVKTRINVKPLVKVTELAQTGTRILDGARELGKVIKIS